MSFSLSSESKALLCAIGVDPLAPLGEKRAPLPLDLEAVSRLLKEPSLRRPDRCRDRQGTTALGCAAYLGRVEAMQLLLERGADIEAENIDGATPLSMACFGKSAAAMAMLLVYGGDELDTTDAFSDAHATGAKDVIAVLDAWENGDSNPHLAQADRMFADSEPAIRLLAEEALSDTHAPDWKALAEAAETRALAAEARAEAAEACLREEQRLHATAHRRALVAEALLREATGTAQPALSSNSNDRDGRYSRMLSRRSTGSPHQQTAGIRQLVGSASTQPVGVTGASLGTLSGMMIASKRWKARARNQRHVESVFSI